MDQMDRAATEGNTDGAAAAAAAIALASDGAQSNNVVNHFHFNISLNANDDVSGPQVIAYVLSAFAPTRREQESVNEAATSGTQGHRGRGIDSSDSEDGARGPLAGQNRRTAALRFVRQERMDPDSDSSSVDDPAFVPPPTQASRRQSQGSVQARPGLCAKCQNAPPTHAPLCMHLYCEPCIKKMSLKKRPCVVCGKAFRAVKNLYLP